MPHEDQSVGNTNKKASSQENLVQAPAISLPKGGGSIKSIDEKFSVNSVNGTASLSFPLPASDARGYAPSLALSYNSGNGNSIFGMGWSLEIPSIRRKTEKKLPCYQDTDDSDTYIFSGAEDLVPVLKKQGNSWVKDGRSTADYAIRYYRPRTEGMFSRIERWTSKTDGAIHWRVVSKDNAISIFGQSSSSRLHDPADPLKIFEWFVEFTHDDKHNCSQYEYVKENDLGAPVHELHQRNRQNGLSPYTNIYPKRIRYGNRTPYKTPGDLRPPASDYLFETVFDFGEHAVASPCELTPGTDWQYRNDAFSQYRAGFEIRTNRLCKSVLLFHRNFELTDLPGGEALVKSLRFVYDNNEQNGFTFLKQLLTTGYTKHDDGHYTEKTLPPVEFNYEKHAWNTRIKNISTEDLRHAPAGINEPAYQWIDLYNEGISGILTEQAEGLFYKSNLGNGSFSNAKLISPKPSFIGLGSRLQILELEANGVKQLAQLSQEPRGFFELAENREWQPFKTFSNIPNIDFTDKNLRQLDLDGDGLADLLISEDRVFRWYSSKGKAGFDRPGTVLKPSDEEKGPAMIFADETESIFIADMSGDGMADIVRIRNGEVCYWPNLGYGNFGPKVGMDASPLFDKQDQFSPEWIRLADIDGSGTTDIIYLGKNKFRAWMNLQGNRFAELPFGIDPFPEIDNHSKIAVLDLLGTGTSCIVWNSAAPKHKAAPLRYIDLMDSRKPHILTAYKNNLGKEIVIEYTSSTHYYLEDKKNGMPWITKLPFPVICVSKTISYDRIRKTRFASEYSYHHGYFDSFEREFRGFGRVEQTDSEDIAHFIKNSGGMSNNIEERDLHQHPVLIKSWFHTGFFMNKHRVLNQYAHEYHQNLSHPENLLQEPRLPETLSHTEWREALRACKGTLLRKEIYAKDNSVDEDKPYVAEQHNFVIKRLQEQAINMHAVFLVHENESVIYHYERNMTDPRIGHNFVLKIDDYGNPLQAAAVGYGRFSDDPDLIAEQQAEQKKIHIICNEAEFTPAINGNDHLRLPLPWRSRSYEIANMPLPASGTFYTFAEIFSACADAPGKTIDYHEPVTGAGIKKRLIESERIRYRDDDGVTILPFGTGSLKALIHETAKAAFTPGLLQNIFNPLIPYAELRDKLTLVDLDGGGGYLLDDGYFWIRSGTQNYDPDHFFQSDEFRDAFNQPTFVEFDPVYRLFPVRITDAAGNESRILDFNYRTLSPLRMQDPNGNCTAVRYNELGMVAQSFIIGKDSDFGDLFDETKKEFSPADQPSAEQEYFISKWYDQSRDAGFDVTQPYKPEPNYVRSKIWEIHYKVNPARTTQYRESFIYSDGNGNVLLTKAPAEGGEALRFNPDGTVTTVMATRRWIGNGRIILNNKGNAVKKYEPYFSINHSFDDEKEMVELGVTPVLHYDPIGRNTRTDNPNGTFSEMQFTPWKQLSFDPNDTVLRSDWLRKIYAPAAPPREGDPLPTGATPEQKAAWLTIKHAETPSVIYLDTLGRNFLLIADNKTETFSTLTVFDSEGNVRSTIDPLNRVAMAYEYGMLGNKIFQQSIDAGKRWMLNDVTGKSLIAWDEKGNTFRFRYDALHRPLESYVDNSGTTLMYERAAYGEDAPSPEVNNMRGKTWKVYDPSGIVTNTRYDFKGNLLGRDRQLCRNYKTAVDWTTIALVELETEIFESSIEYDALNRPLMFTTPHTASIPRNEIIPRYNQTNKLAGIDVKLRGSASSTSFISTIDYNARGQRTFIRYANNTQTRYTYDSDSWRLTNIFTIRNSDTATLQDISYTFDPAGNITRIYDAAQPEFIHLGVPIKPLNEYTYDAQYRLSSATGREHRGQCAVDHNGVSSSYRDHPFVPFSLAPGVNEAEAFRNYVESYLYDHAGNMQQQRHDTTEAATGWVRTFQYGGAGADENQDNRLYRTAIGSFNYTYGNEADNGYDKHGNMLRMEHLSVINWDFKDHFVHSRKGTVDAYYVYDSSGERIRKVLEDAPDRRQKERLYLGGLEIYREYTPGGDLKTQRESLHIMDDKKRAALVETLTVKNSALLNTPETLQRYQYDNHLGSASLELDDAGLKISYEEYFPFGTTSFYAVDSMREVPDKRYRYTGKERDDESGLNYHSARYYAPWLCRWTKCDPKGVKDGLNQYAYVRNNPVIHTDPSGTTTLAQARAALQNYIREGAQLRQEVVDTGMQIARTITEANTLNDGEPVSAGLQGLVRQQNTTSANTLNVLRARLADIQRRIRLHDAAGRQVVATAAEAELNVRQTMPDTWQQDLAELEQIQDAGAAEAVAAGRAADALDRPLAITASATRDIRRGTVVRTQAELDRVISGPPRPPRIPPGEGGPPPPPPAAPPPPPAPPAPPAGQAGLPPGEVPPGGGNVARSVTTIEETAGELIPTVTRFERFVAGGQTVIRGGVRIGGRVLFFVGIGATIYFTGAALYQGDYTQAALEAASIYPPIAIGRLVVDIGTPAVQQARSWYEDLELEARHFFGL